MVGNVVICGNTFALEKSKNVIALLFLRTAIAGRHW